jgi:hypothetical protein
MTFLRLIDLDGKEHYAVDVAQLYELIKAGKVNYECLVRDDSQERWVRAREHPYFIRIRNLATETASAIPPHSVSSDDSTAKPVSQVEGNSQRLVRAVEAGHRFLITSICFYGLAIVISLVALKLGVQVGRKALVVLIATPILFPIGLRAFIPLMRLFSQHRHSSLIPLSAIEALARDGRYIVGGALFTGVLFAAAVALGI